MNYKFLDEFLSGLGDIRKAKKDNMINKSFEKRIMLAVTQVNGCQMCSYFHSKEALRHGMDKKHIQDLLSGELGEVPEKEAPALLFAQHYADKAGAFDDAAWQRIINIYGEKKAKAIMAYIRAIMVGNAQGNVFGAFKSRICGHPEKGSTFLMEISVIISDLFIMPFIILKTAALRLVKNRH